MRFIITAQAGADGTRSGAQDGLDEKLLVAYMAFNEEMHKAGVLVAAEGLNPAARGARVAVSKGKRHLVDGPFTESKELVGGFYIVDVKSLDEAIQWALRVPCGLGIDDVLEIRQLTGAGDIPPEVNRIIKSAAPTWSASVWQAREQIQD
ncbi:YciI family protein [Piscinibacter sp. XHJ-5]|uniref:YciI family protein n=1 Tax=Piscinibacter sp. XHJ-5 TaxID=3037797 RepID=UPI002452F1BF|nr:YciI family protein [Piscinibacter sp. XHJ-5]